MHISTLSLVICLTSSVLGFPSRLFDPSTLTEQEIRALDGVSSTAESPEVVPRQLPGVVPGFSAKAQYVSNQGAHKYVAPGAGDQRGPCPGLNAMANHNYLPHNGIATIAQFVQGTYDVFGMGLDLGTFLSVYGAVFDGDLTSWSIGGPSAALPAVGSLGQPQGISGSHNKYESDVSPTRGDLYQYGNDYSLRLPQFKALYSRALGPRGYDLSVLTPFRAERFQQSIQQNPYFFNGPFSGVLVQPAAYTFIYRFMGNKSAQYPDGYLSGDVLKTFFAISGATPAQFKYNEGQEQIPNNWYKRAIGDEYTIPYFNLDLLAAAAQYPEFLSVGGNTGKPNTFTGVDINSLTGGVFNAATLAQGNNLLCFGFQFASQAAPDLLKAQFADVTKPLGQLGAMLAPILQNLGCPQLKSVDDSQFAKYGKGASGAY